jgi:hypothetical protein
VFGLAWLVCMSQYCELCDLVGWGCTDWRPGCDLSVWLPRRDALK